MEQRTSPRIERIVQLILEELDERQRVRDKAASPARSVAATHASAQVTPEEPPVGVPPGLPMPERRHEPGAPAGARAPGRSAGPSHTSTMLARLALGVLIAVVVINIPLSRRGTTLATAMPDSAAMILRDGLVVKESGLDEIYVYQDGRFRWISSLDAFEHYGFTWEDVHTVEQGFLEEFELGPPLHVLLKCATSPHIYRLEAGEKRWIVDIAAFEAEGHVWEDVRVVPCERLRNLPDGETVPPGQGPPPQP